jgi:hypothetical protein
VQTAPLTASETEWVGLQLSTAALLVKAYTGDSEDLPRLDQLDATWLAWQDDASSTRPEANIVVNALGIVFGKHLATALGLEWAIVTDDYGTDLAVFGQPNDVTFFPANMISKRLELREPIFSQLHGAAVGSVRELRLRSKK